MKTCFKCNELKPFSDFYKHSAMTDGYLNKCKVCTKSDVNKHRSVNIEKIRAYDRERAKHPDRIKSNVEQTKMWRSQDKRRSYAHSQVSQAIKKGTLIKIPCERCGCEQSLAHHEDYDKPLDVVWLCQPCHKQRHKELKLLEK